MRIDRTTAAATNPATSAWVEPIVSIQYFGTVPCDERRAHGFRGDPTRCFRRDFQPAQLGQHLAAYLGSKLATTIVDRFELASAAGAGEFTHQRILETRSRSVLQLHFPKAETPSRLPFLDARGLAARPGSTLLRTLHVRNTGCAGDLLIMNSVSPQMIRLQVR
jgi:hypothetical protein